MKKFLKRTQKLALSLTLTSTLTACSLNCGNDCEKCKECCEKQVLIQNQDPKIQENAQRPQTTPLRDTIPEEFKWKTERLFTDVQAWQSKADAIPQELNKFSECESIFAKNSINFEKLESCLNLYFDLHTEVNKLTLFANMQNDTIATEETANRQQVALKLHDEFMHKSEVLRNIILKLSQKDIDNFVAKTKTGIDFKNYLMNIIRRSSRRLSPDAERVLQLAGDNLWAEIDLNELPSDSEKVFDATLDNLKMPVVKDENGTEIQLDFANYSVFRRSPNRDVRKNAVNALFSSLKDARTLLAQAYLGQVKTDILFAKARNYPTALDAYMDKDNIDTAVYKNLIQSVNANLKPLHRYVALRKQLLNLDAVHFYDLYVPLTAESQKEYAFSDASTLIQAALTPLGENYAQKLTKALDTKLGSIDLLPHKNKRSGAYSASVYGVEPFVLMNYQNSLDDVSTLAHELGHALHSSYSMETQHPSTFHYTSFIAEIASTTNESLLNDYLLKNAKTDEERVELLVSKLENIRATIYRQTLFAEFELSVHTAVENGQTLNADALQELYASLVKKYYGSEDYVLDELDGYEWSYIPHFYYKYYVYTYATGLASALTFAKRIQESPQNAELYINMLRAGANDAPIQLLKNAGVDLTTEDPAQNPIYLALAEFNATIDQLEAIFNKNLPET